MDTFADLETAAQSPEDPAGLFASWMAEAEAAEINDPNAMGLATIDPDGTPSLRIVLLKQLDDRGFVFFTNRESHKGNALAAHPVVALCFHWKSLRRQVRVTGPVSMIDDVESDAYYASRPVGSRIGAWASQQSRPLDTRSTLAARVRDLEIRFENNAGIPRPPYWGGYRVAPQTIEFWHDGASRLHTRVLYTKIPTGWRREMLYP